MSDLYNAIFHRKSIRKYDMTPLPAEALADIKEYAVRLEPLHKSIKIEFDYLRAGDVKNILPIKAPHYICIYSQTVDGYLMNAGYLLQQVDLYISSKGLGGCWLGMAKPAKGIPTQKNGLDFVIMLAFGNAAEPVNVHRTELSEFKRKNLSEITDIRGSDEILNAVRLAPSASNTQPWYFSGNSGNITVYRVKLGIIKAPIYDKMNQIDIGIALCYLRLSAKYMGKRAEFYYGKCAAPKGYHFMAKVEIK